MHQNEASVTGIANARQTKIFMAIFALAVRLPTSATLVPNKNLHTWVILLGQSSNKFTSANVNCRWTLDMDNVHWTFTYGLLGLSWDSLPLKYPLHYVKRRSQLRGPFGDEGIDIIGPHVAKTFRLHPFFPVSEAKSCSVRKRGPFSSRWQQ